MTSEAEAFGALTLLVAVLEQASLVVSDLGPPHQHEELVERIDRLRNLVVAELQTERFSGTNRPT